MNYIEKVIFRIDFLSPIDVQQKLEGRLVLEIIKYFKRAQAKKVAVGEISETQWVFSSDENNQLTVGTNLFLVEMTKYNSFEINIQERIFSILNVLFQIYSPQIRRIGLRYTNKLPEDNIIYDNILFYKTNYIDYNIHSSLSTTILVSDFAGIELTFRIVQGKPEKQTIVDSPNFLLDLDGSTIDTIYDYENTVRIIEKIHQEIKDIMKRSIKIGE